MNKENFYNYLKARYKNGESSSYESYFGSIDSLGKLEEMIFSITQENIFSIKNINGVNDILNKLKNNSDWKRYNSSRGHGVPNAILNTHYKAFLTSAKVSNIDITNDENLIYLQEQARLVEAISTPEGLLANKDKLSVDALIAQYSNVNGPINKIRLQILTNLKNNKVFSLEELLKLKTQNGVSKGMYETYLSYIYTFIGEEPAKRLKSLCKSLLNDLQISEEYKGSPHPFDGTRNSGEARAWIALHPKTKSFMDSWQFYISITPKSIECGKCSGKNLFEKYDLEEQTVSSYDNLLSVLNEYKGEIIKLNNELFSNIQANGIEKLNWSEIAAIAMYLDNKSGKYRPFEVEKLPFVLVAKKAKNRENPSIATELRECSDDIASKYNRKSRNYFIRLGEEYKLSNGGIKHIEDNLKEFLNYTSNNEVLNMNDCNTSLNQILYGPPGTGKTWSTKRLVSEIINPQINNHLDELTKINDVFDQYSVTWYQALAIAMYRNNSDKYKVAELKNSNEIKAYLLGRTNNSVNAAIWGNLQVHTHPDVTTVKYSQRQEPYLFEKKDGSYWVLTNEGKEYVENDLSEVLENLNVDKSTGIEDFREFITFHQSYSYEEFVEGIKPYEKANGDVGYKVKDGIFKKICIKAQANPHWNYVLVIDEINRGNIAKILGELITLIECDKRLGAKNELTITLPYSQTPFSVPKNLYIIGTMNTADKSLALLDVALRRRFDFIPMYPIYEIDKKPIPHSEFLKKLNNVILEKKKQNADYLIGHSYFIDENMPELKDILNKKVIPLLMEYFNNNKQTVKEILREVKEDIEFNTDEGIYHLEVQ